MVTIVRIKRIYSGFESTKILKTSDMFKYSLGRKIKELKCSLCMGKINFGKEKSFLCPFCLEQDHITAYHLTCAEQMVSQDDKSKIFTCIVCGNEYDLTEFVEVTD